MSIENPKASFNTGNPLIDNAPRDASILSQETFGQLIADHNLPEESQQVIAMLALTDQEDIILRYHNFFGPYVRSADPTADALSGLMAQLSMSTEAVQKADASGLADKASAYRRAAILDSGLIYLTQNHGPSITRAISRCLEDR